MKNVLCANTSNCCATDDVGWIDLSVAININMLRFWNKLIDLISNERLTKIKQQMLQFSEGLITLIRRIRAMKLFVE